MAFMDLVGTNALRPLVSIYQSASRPASGNGSIAFGELAGASSVWIHRWLAYGMRPSAAMQTHREDDDVVEHSGRDGNADGYRLVFAERKALMLFGSRNDELGAEDKAHIEAGTPKHGDAGGKPTAIQPRDEDCTQVQSDDQTDKARIKARPWPQRAFIGRSGAGGIHEIA
jgi:hypothetical protein